MNNKILVSCNMFFVCSVLIIIIIWLIITLLSWDWQKYDLGNDKMFKKAHRKSNLWLTVSMFWMIAEYVLTILPFEATVKVIYLDAYSYEKQGILIYSIISLALIVFSFAINPARHKRCYRKAYQELDYAINCYIEVAQRDDEKEKKIVMKQLLITIDSGEKYINGSYDVK